MLERMLNAMFAAVAPTLLAVPAIALWQGARFEWLRSAGGHGSELLLALYAAATLLLALPRGALVQWRLALWLVAGECAGAALLGWSAEAPLRAAMALGCGTVAVCCGWTALRLRPARKDAARRMGHAAVGASRDGDARSWMAAIGTALPWVLVAAGAVLSFVLALDERGPGKNAGALALLAMVLLGVPAAALRRWLPRTAATLWLLDAALLALSAWRGGGMGLAAMAAGAAAAALVTLRPAAEGRIDGIPLEARQ